jgi:aryl-alcohol dehydrogenase-like predicted oxidoreductase
MRDALRTLLPRSREDAVLVVQSYARQPALLRRSVESALRELRASYADVLLLGWLKGAPAPALLEAAFELVELGRVRHLGVSSHDRPLFGALLAEPRFEVWHARYNAAHRGAEAEVFPLLAKRPTTQRPGLVTFTTTRWGTLCDAAFTPAGQPTPTGTDCYRFALSQPDVDVVMAGPADERELEQALAALELGPMSEPELAWMRRVGDHVRNVAAKRGLVSRAPRLVAREWERLRGWASARWGDVLR